MKKKFINYSVAALAIVSAVAMAGCGKKVTYKESDLKQTTGTETVAESTVSESTVSESTAESVDVEESTEAGKSVPENDGGKSAEVSKVTEVIEEKRENKAITDPDKQTEIIEKIKNKLNESKDSYGIEGNLDIEIIKFNKEDYTPARYFAESTIEIKRDSNKYYLNSITDSTYKGDRQIRNTTVYLIDSGERTVSYSKSYDTEREEGGLVKWLGATVARDLETEEINFKGICENLDTSTYRVGEERVDGVECYTLTCYYPLYEALELARVNPEFIGVIKKVDTVVDNKGTDESTEETVTNDDGIDEETLKKYNATIKLYVNKSDYNLIRYEMTAERALEVFYQNVYEADPNRPVTYQMQTCKGSFKIGRYNGITIDIPDEITERMPSDAKVIIDEQGEESYETSMTLDGDFNIGISFGNSTAEKTSDDEGESSETSENGEAQETLENNSEDSSKDDKEKDMTEESKSETVESKAETVESKAETKAATVETTEAETEAPKKKSGYTGPIIKN